jgi:predicted dehydrogenase
MTVSIAIAGVGGWGQNLVRNYFQIPGVKLACLCDLDDRKLNTLSAKFAPGYVTTNFADVVADGKVDAVVIATSAVTHYDLCRSALLGGKDVYVEKPFVLDSSQAKELIDLAAEKSRILMVGHLLQYHPVVTHLKQMITGGELGHLLYLYSQRLNLGTVREDENALWNFAPHDVSTMLYLTGKKPLNVAARGACYLRRGVEDVVFLNIEFADHVVGNVHVSWLDPHKTRKLTVVGDRRMAVFDDAEAQEKLRIYDKGVDRNIHYDTFAEYMNLRFGDIRIPHLKVGEPLRLECEHFLECVRERKRPRSDGLDGLRVVQVLEGASRSLANGGVPVAID